MNRAMKEKQAINDYPMRRRMVLLIFVMAMGSLLWRAFDLQILRQDFLRDHGDARSLRVVDIPSHRGMITDRNGEPLAISTPVSSIWTTPHELLAESTSIKKLADAIDMEESELQSMLKERISRKFVYLKRHVSPETENKIMALELPGVYRQREYRRYYPAGEVTAHIIGFTNVDDEGQEGLELAYNDWLKGKNGKKRVLKDRLGRIIENIESIEPPSKGKELQLSIDKRIQYLAYRELKASVNYHKAKSATLVMLDAKTGEVVSMVSQPSYNPNNRSGLKSSHFRNRTVTDVFEPGSTMKPFTVSAALASGLYQAGSMIDTTPGFYKVGAHTIRDIKNYGPIDIATVIKKSSNVGASKIALSLEPSYIWKMLSRLGFGQPTGSGFPGESGGRLDGYNNWSEVELATLSFGYGLSVTALQLAQAYSVLAADGLVLPVSYTKVSGTITARRAMPKAVAQQVISMMEAVTQPDGTGKRAGVIGYRIAGKTGTAHKSTRGGYADNRYLSLFAGIAPASDPRLVMVIMIDEPQAGQYYGGQVAAPVFSRVMDGALRILNLPPDNIPGVSAPVIAGTNGRGETLQ